MLVAVAVGTKTTARSVVEALVLAGCSSEASNVRLGITSSLLGRVERSGTNPVAVPCPATERNPVWVSPSPRAEALAAPPTAAPLISTALYLRTVATVGLAVAVRHTNTAAMRSGLAVKDSRVRATTAEPLVV